MFKSLKSKMLFRILLVVIIGVSVIGAMSSVLNFSSTADTLESTLSELALQCSVRVQNRMARYTAIVTELGMDTRFSDSAATDEEREELLSRRQDTYGFISHGFIDRTGKDMNGNDYSTSSLYTRAMQGESFVSNPQWIGDTQVIYIVAPVKEGGFFNGDCVGSIYFGLNGSVLQEIVSEIVVGETGRAYIMDSTGTYIANPTNQLVVNKTNNIQNPAGSSADYSCRGDLERQAISMTDVNDTAFGEIQGGGAHKYIAFSKIDGTDGWTIAVSSEYSEHMNGTIVSVLLTVVVSVVLVIAACIVCIFTANSIVNPIKKTAKVMEEVAQGNLDVAVSHKSNDELGALSQDIDSTIGALKKYVNEISRICKQLSEGNFDVYREIEFHGDFVQIIEALDSLSDGLSDTMEQIDIAAAQVSTGAGQIASGATSLASGSTEQASSTEELASIIATLHEKVNANANNAADADKKANLAGEKIKQSDSYMRDMIKAMNNISDKSNQISNIIKTIGDIAFQTNILALNAAVEAARAGEAGKGFAVVAEEVRNLASKTAEAAQSTTELIQQSIEAVESGSDIANETAQALNASVEVTNETVKLINEISIASGEQASMIEQVNVGVDQISSVVQVNAATAEESAAASEELNGQAVELQNLTGRFTLKKK